ncbi:MAG TPA: methyltransferase, partial [Candidatus Paceibacterota bacterium]|nr:methyltransferase [Candidatus Paceibacterota bacterium]
MDNSLPQGLYEKHAESLGLPKPRFFATDADLFGEETAPAESAVVFLPKSKALIDMTLCLVSGAVRNGGAVVLAGGNDAGIRSAKDAYERNIGPVEQKIVGNHSALYVGRNTKHAAAKTWKDFLSFSPLSHEGMTIEAANLPGVFSAGELDPGTALLLEKIPYDPKRVLDIGSGAGIIGAFYKKKNPAAEVTLSDASALAIRASEE